MSPFQGRDDDRAAIILRGAALEGRTSLLGNGGGFVFHLPATVNIRERTLLPSKWFGLSGFGRHYLSAIRLWIERDGRRLPLDRSVTTEFRQDLDGVTRNYQVEGMAVRQSYFVPDHIQALVLRVEADDGWSVVVEPEFDMRYYQLFNTVFSGYAAHCAGSGDNLSLEVENHVPAPVAGAPPLDFYASLRSLSGAIQIDLLPPAERLRPRTYLVDEARRRLIQAAYSETHEQSPDQAPIWDECTTTEYVPAQIVAPAPLELVIGCDTTAADAHSAVANVRRSSAGLRTAKERTTVARLERAQFATGVTAIDTAYSQVLTRFNDCLVARDLPLRHGPSGGAERFNAIFAGDKYFLDAWKRDENISLIAMLVTGDYRMVRAILGDTWRFQDPRTGRLPHIIRLGEPLVYYSSDGTLWALRRLQQYTRLSGDETLLEEKYAMVEQFFTASLNFVQRGLLPSGGIIDPAYRWETWEDTPYTPRDGYPVEIELLWLTALADYLPVIRVRNAALAERLEETLNAGRQSMERFSLDGYLADSLSYDWEPRPLLTPNGYMAFELGYALPPDLARSMVQLARTELAGQVGVRSLARRDWPRVLSPEFMADPRNFHDGHMASVGIYNYHRGIEWLWLNQFLVMAELQYGDARHAFDLYIHGLVHEALHQGGAGGLSELYDMRGPLGADYQAWSMAGLIVALHAFAGIDGDAHERRLTVLPNPPENWPFLHCRSRVGDTRFDLAYRRPEPGHLVLDVNALDPIPPGYSAHLGVRLPDGRDTARLRLNGRDLEGDIVQVRATEDGEYHATVQLPWQPHLRLEFS